MSKTASRLRRGLLIPAAVGALFTPIGVAVAVNHHDRSVQIGQDEDSASMVHRVDDLIGASSFSAAGLNDVVQTPVQLPFVCSAIAEQLGALSHGASARTEAKYELATMDPDDKFLNPVLRGLVNRYFDTVHDAEAELANLPKSGGCGRLQPGHAVDASVLTRWKAALDDARAFSAGWSALTEPYGIPSRDFVHV